MTKKMIIGISMIIVLVGGFLAWICFQDIIRENSTAELSEQKVSVVVVDTDVEGLVVEASVEQAGEDGYPSLVVLLTNNTKGDMVLSEESVYFKKGDEWKQRLSTVGGQLLGKQSIYGSDTIDRLSQQLEDPSSMTNEREISKSPWKVYEHMTLLGEYRFELVIEDESGNKLGSVWVEWTQELK